MANSMKDQAEGLRRLLVKEVQEAQGFPHVLTIASGSTGAGKTSTVINLAASLARSGKNVLVIDENAGATNLAGTLGLNAHRDLLNVIRRDKTLEEVIISCAEGFRLLPAGWGMRLLEKLGSDEWAHLVDCFDSFSQPTDFLLIDAAAGRASQLLLLSLSGHEIVVVVSPEPASITAAYALIKHINGGHGTQRFRVLINKARAESEAQVIFNNMAHVANHYLAVSLDFMGFVPLDDKLRQSIRAGRSVIEAFPAAASAAAFRRAAESISYRSRTEGEESESKGLGRFMQCLMQDRQSNSGQNHHDIKSNGGSQSGSKGQGEQRGQRGQGGNGVPLGQTDRNNTAAKPIKDSRGPMVRHV